MHILLTDPCSCPKVLTRRIFVTIKSFFAGDHILYSHDLNVLFRGNIVVRKAPPPTLGGGGKGLSINHYQGHLPFLELPVIR